MIRRAIVASSAAVLLATAACAPKVNLALPAGAGTPLADLAVAEQAARASCRMHPAITAELRLSGRIDGERVRGTLQVGVTRDAMRLEGLAPFGAPVFVLAAQPGGAVLLLPRETAVARGDSALELLDAAVGVALTPQDLLAIVSGCGVADWNVSGGATFSGGWTRLDLDQARALWLRGGRGRDAAARCGAGQSLADRVHADERGMADRDPPAAAGPTAPRVERMRCWRWKRRRPWRRCPKARWTWTFPRAPAN